MSKGKNNREACAKEFDAWLDFKRVSASKRADNEANEKVLVDAMEEGSLTINPDDSFSMKYDLVFPIGNEGQIKSMTFKSRMTVADKKPLAKVDPMDADGRLAAILAALSGQHTRILGELDTEDMRTLQSLAVYFL